MRKFLWLLAMAAGISVHSLAQDSTVNSMNSATVAPSVKKDWKKVNLNNRANDHFMIQFGYEGWSGAPDTASIKGLSRFFNFYLMYDMPFKTSPRFSVAAGLGVSTSSIYFDKANIDIAGKVNPNRINFSDASATNHFKTYSLNNTWLEVPVELRFVTDPVHTGKAWKLAIGAKVGTMTDAHTRGKNLLNATGGSLYGTGYVEKERSKRFFNTTKLAVTLRGGYGPITLFGSYMVTGLFKENQGPVIHPFSIGLSIAGL